MKKSLKKRAWGLTLLPQQRMTTRNPVLELPALCFGDFADLPSFRFGWNQGDGQNSKFEIDILLNRKGSFEFAPTGWYCLHLYHHLNPFNTDRRLSW